MRPQLCLRNREETTSPIAKRGSFYTWVMAIFDDRARAAG
jgi:hypothetical protein